MHVVTKDKFGYGGALGMLEIVTSRVVIGGAVVDVVVVARRGDMDPLNLRMECI